MNIRMLLLFLLVLSSSIYGNESYYKCGDSFTLIRPKTIAYDEEIDKRNDVPYAKIRQLQNSILDKNYFDVVDIDHWKVIWERVPRFLVKRPWGDGTSLGDEYANTELFATKRDPIGSIVQYFDTVNSGLDRVEVGGDVANCYDYIAVQAALMLVPSLDLKYTIFEEGRAFIAEINGGKHRLVYILVSADFLEVLHLYDMRNRRSKGQ